MPDFIRLLNEIHRVVGDRTAYVAAFRDGYPGLIYFLADLKPAPISLDPSTMVLTEPQQVSFENEFRTRTVKNIQALLTNDLQESEPEAFMAAYPGYRKVVLSYGTHPYYILLR